MSLMEDFNVPCVRLVPRSAPDGGGGTKTVWEETDTFSAAIVFDSSLAARKAEKDGVTSLYTVTVDRSLVFSYHDVFRRMKDGKVFRITSGDGRHTPDRASFQLAQFTAEEWRLPK